MFATWFMLRWMEAILHHPVPPRYSNSLLSFADRCNFHPSTMLGCVEMANHPYGCKSLGFRIYPGMLNLRMLPFFWALKSIDDTYACANKVCKKRLLRALKSRSNAYLALVGVYAAPTLWVGLPERPGNLKRPHPTSP